MLNVRFLSTRIVLTFLLIVPMTSALPDEAEGPENVPKLATDNELKEDIDFSNCICQCLEPAGGDLLCRYNTTDPGVPPTPSCMDLSNGPCICEGMIGCFRGPLLMAIAMSVVGNSMSLIQKLMNRPSLHQDRRVT